MRSRCRRCTTALPAAAPASAAASVTPFESALVIEEFAGMATAYELIRARGHHRKYAQVRAAPDGGDHST
jgi:hypothetical protein